MQRETRMIIAIGSTAIIVLLLGVLWWHSAQRQISTAFETAPQNDKTVIDIGTAFGTLGQQWHNATAQPKKSYGTPQKNTN